MIPFAKRIMPAALALAAGAVVVLPAILLGMPNNNDLANHYHFAIPFYEALGHGDLYPSLFASPNFGYGDVIVRFYPPALYYLFAAGRFLAGNWYAGSLMTITVVSALGSLAAYFWARCYVPRNLAIMAGLFYALMPYHLAEFYQAAQLAEFAAGAALLFALAFTKRLCDHNRWRDAAGLAAAYAGLVLSHLPLAVFGSLTLGLYAIVNLRRSDLRSVFMKLAGAIAVGLGASAFYWVTMVSEMKWIVADGAHPDPMLDYSHNFVFSSFSPDKQETIWWMGLLAIATLLMCLPAVFSTASEYRQQRQRSVVALFGVLIFAFVMCTALSKPVWAVIPYLRMTQHPFRWLAVVSVIAPVLMATAVPFWQTRLRNHLRPVALMMCGCVLIAVAFSLTQTVRGARYLSRTHFDQIVTPLNEAPGIIQWLPIWAIESAKGQASYEKCTPPVALNQIDAGQRAVHISQWNDTTRSFAVDAGAPGDARVATFYYPHWQASVNGRRLPTSSAKDGALLVSLPDQAVNVTLEFREPARTKIADGISIISWTLIAAILILGTFAAARHELTAN
ncbi:MAG TPA: 6-pyruvoyl-tetrahydropterin synthase-related protein [Pyrinomonadaceae bacterium]|nr:6-pyruvoyl-tetrahydropterin synthase-related protein [Pyrinomonadaceae bacterium]